MKRQNPARLDPDLNSDQKRLTPKQAKVLAFVENEITRAGRPPSLREIAKHFGYSAVGTVEDHIKALKKKGYLSQAPGIVCGIRPSYLAESISIPILGSVPAGKPLEAIQSASGFLSIPNRWRGDLYALRVRGDSMIDAGILEGDLVVVKKQDTAEHGEIIVATVDGEATVKYLDKKKNKPRLLPANSRYSPIELDPSRENRIVGKVVSVQRYLS